jgi:hypothetical protein
MKVILGRIYRYYPNGSRRFHNRLLVRVIGFNTPYARVKSSPTGMSIPYNFAKLEDFGRATKAEIQAFVERMPLK